MKTYRVAQVATICDVAPRTVARWIDLGVLQGYRLPASTHRRVSKESLIAFLKERGMPQTCIEGLEAEKETEETDA